MLKLVGNFSDCPQNLTVGRHINSKTVSANFFFRNIFSMRAIFVPILHIFLILFRKWSTFSLKLNMANRRHVSLALWARKLRDTLNKRKTKFALTCNVQKVIQALAFRSREKFDNSFLFKIVGIV